MVLRPEISFKASTSITPAIAISRRLIPETAPLEQTTPAHLSLQALVCGTQESKTPVDTKESLSLRRASFSVMEKVRVERERIRILRRRTGTAAVIISEPEMGQLGSRTVRRGWIEFLLGKLSDPKKHKTFSRANHSSSHKPMTSHSQMLLSEEHGKSLWNPLY